MVLVALVLFVLTITAAVDALSRREEPVRGLPAPAWAVVALVPLVGPLAWFRWGRPRGVRDPRPRVTGPDDDEDFLRRL